MLVNGMLVAALVVLSCLVSLMVVFIGGHGPDLMTLLAAQGAAALAAAVVTVLGMGPLIAARGVRGAFSIVWTTLPGWLVRILISFNSLAIAGEMSLLAVPVISDTPVAASDHVPLLTILVASTAFVVLYTHYRLGPQRQAIGGAAPTERQAR